MRADSRAPQNPWLVVALLWLTVSINYVGRVLITTMRDPVVAAVPMTEAQFGLLTSVFLWVYGLANPFGGFLADRFSRRRVIIWCTVAGSIATGLTAYTVSFPQMLATRALVGLSQACEVPAAMAMIADYHRGPTRSLATGVLLTGSLFGATVGGAGGWLAEMRSWSFAFELAGWAGLLCGAALVLALRDPPKPAPEGKTANDGKSEVGFGRALASLFRRYSFGLILICSGLAGAVNRLVVGWMPTYLRERFHLGLASAGFSATVYVNVATALFLLVGGVWADRWSVSYPRARIWVPVIGLTVASPAFVIAGTTHTFAFAALGLILWGLSNGFFSCNLMPILCLIADPRYRATGYGLINASICITGGLLVFAAGVLRDNKVDLGKVFAWSSLALLLCAVLLLALRPTQEDAPAAAERKGHGFSR